MKAFLGGLGFIIVVLVVLFILGHLGGPAGHDPCSGLSGYDYNSCTQSHDNSGP
jgi:hypothetical protein